MSDYVCPMYEGITQEFIKSVLDLKNGRFFWRDTPYKKRGAKVGDVADHVMIAATGHMAVDIFPYSFSSARLAILWETGQKVFSTPKHKNGDNGDNRIENLSWKRVRSENKVLHVGSRQIPFTLDEALVVRDSIQALIDSF